MVKIIIGNLKGAIGMDIETYKQLIDVTSDTAVAAIIVLAGLYLFIKGMSDDGWKLIIFGGGYLFGKSLPAGNK